MDNLENDSRPLFEAIKEGKLFETHEALDYGADINSKDSKGNRPIHYACMDEKCTKIADGLIEREAELNVPNNSGIYPLHYAVKSHDYKLVNNLIYYGASTTSKDGKGEQLVHYLAKDTNIEAARILDDIDNNVQDNSGKYPMHILAESALNIDDIGYWRYFDICQIYFKDNFNKYPIDYLLEATKNRATPFIQEVLKEYMLIPSYHNFDVESDPVVGALLGVAIGDAVGVPYEFKRRYQMKENPATDMVGNGTYSQVAGTWSDDSSLTFCLAESLVNGYNLADISAKFVDWIGKSYWTAHGEVFDAGMTVEFAIRRLKKILKEGNLEELETQKDYSDSDENGNGSLMRIMPLLFYIDGMDIKEQFEIIFDVSALTHRHIRAAMSCMIYLKFAENLFHGKSKDEAYSNTREVITTFWKTIDFPEWERKHFTKLIQNDIRDTSIDDLKSGGYVIEVLESSFWMFLNNSNYKDTILSIINLGHDTDTSAAIAGGLAGLYYKLKGMPHSWLKQTARLKDIVELGANLSKVRNT